MMEWLRHRSAQAEEERLRAQVGALFGRPQSPKLVSPFPRWLSHFELRKEIGASTRGAVYLARDQRLNRFVAIKALKPCSDQESSERFRREALCAAALNNSNIAAVYELERHQGLDFIVMEYVSGHRLDQLIPARGVALRTCLDYMRQMTRALTSVHSARMMHRDLKPSNFIITIDGLVKLLDFGLARAVDRKRSYPARRRNNKGPETRDGTILGTPGYMSPEQARGQEADRRSDVFSLGAIFYEMLSGRPAF